MLNIKNSEIAKNSKLLQNYLTASSEAGLTVKETQSVGNSGYPLGSTYTPTGITVVSTDISGNKAVFFAIETEEGTQISLKSLMGVTSLDGYTLRGEAISVSRMSGEPVESVVSASLLSDLPEDPLVLNKMMLNFGIDLYQAVIDLEKDAEEKTGIFAEGTKLQYCGKAVKQLTAKRASDPKKVKFDAWQAGDKRAIATQLWRVL